MPRPPAIGRGVITAWLKVPRNGAPEVDRLRAFLALPSFVQRLATSANSGQRNEVVLVLGLDTIPEGLRSATFGTRALHETLRCEAIVLVATFRGTPPPSLLDRFDLAFHIGTPRHGDWLDSVVRTTRGSSPSEVNTARPLRAQWTALGLPADLVALWTAHGPARANPS